MPGLRKNQGGQSNREKLRECILYDCGCTVCHSTPQYLTNINLRNLVERLQETLPNKQNLLSSYSF